VESRKCEVFALFEETLLQLLLLYISTCHNCAWPKNLLSLSLFLTEHLNCIANLLDTLWVGCFQFVSGLLHRITNSNALFLFGEVVGICIKDMIKCNFKN
jgi:hypothetical protein